MRKKETPTSRKKSASRAVAGAGFEPATFGLCVPATVFTAGPGRTVCGLDFLFTLGQTVRVPAVKSLHLSRQRRDLARDYPARGFPEFDR